MAGFKNTLATVNDGDLKERNRRDLFGAANNLTQQNHWTRPGLMSPHLCIYLTWALKLVPACC